MIATAYEHGEQVALGARQAAIALVDIARPGSMRRSGLGGRENAPLPVYRTAKVSGTGTRGRIGLTQRPATSDRRSRWRADGVAATPSKLGVGHDAHDLPWGLARRRGAGPHGLLRRRPSRQPRTAPISDVVP